MRKAIALVLSFLLLLGLCACAGTAESAEPTAAPVDVPESAEPTAASVDVPESAVTAVFTQEELPVSTDLDGDGLEETMELVLEPLTEDFGFYTFVFTEGGGQQHRIATILSHSIRLVLSDVNGDGQRDLLLSGDAGSDDAYTYAWRYERGLLALPFAGEVRPHAQVEGTHVKGMVESVEDGIITLCSYCYVLGTYESTRPYRWDGEAISPVEGSIFTFVNNNTWLETSAALHCLLEGEPASLGAGTSILLTGTDGSSQVYFTLQNGRNGVLPVRAEGYRWLVEEQLENELFAMLPYAG